MDAFRRNLFIRRAPDESQETVAIDWAFVGSGAVGEELVPLIEASIVFMEVDLSDVLEIENQVLEGYLAGLSDVGWQGDPRQVRLGYTAAASLRYRVGVTDTSSLTDEQFHPLIEQILKKPMGEICDYWAEFFRQSTSRLPVEARKLAQELGLA
jgi:hypothetical protein